jgi:hypothetical protein
MAQPRALENFSLVLGGPLYQLWLRLRLLDPPVRYVERRVAAVVAVTWLPVLLLAALGGTLFGGATIPFFFDVDAHVRLLVALPLLIIAEPVVHWQLSMQVRQLEERGVIAPEDRGRFAAIIDETMRLRNSMAIELVILACALGLGYWIWRQEFASRVGTWYMTPAESLTAAGAWYAFVSLGVFRFVLFRWYFRFVLWYIFLWRVSRLKLQLNALHPDGVGGIGFLGASVSALAPVLIAQSATVSGAIAGQILHEGMKLPAFYFEIGAVVAVLLVVGLAPLVFLVAPLLAASLQGRREYGLLAMRYAEQFRAKWHGGRAQDAELLGSADIQSLADLGVAHERVTKMRVLPLDRQAIVRVAALIALPFAPLVFTVIPLNELLARALKQLL